MSEDGRITVEREGQLLLIGIDRVKKRNAFTVPMFEGVARAFTDLENDPELRCGVLFAHGDHFTAGLDLPHFTGAFAAGKLPVPDGCIDPFRTAPPYLTKPLVTAVQGICLTAGIELMLATDIRIAARDARFGQIEVKRGIYPVGGATIRFVQEAGWGNAMRYLLTGDEFGAEEAYRIGFIQEVVETGRQFARAKEIARTIAEQAPLGVRASKKSAHLYVLKGEETAMARLLPDLQPIMGSQDVQEGVMSFIERRKAVFKGR